MSAPTRIYQQVEAQIKRYAAPTLRITTIRRLATAVVGVLAAEGCTLRRVARELSAMGLRPAQPASTIRRRRRTLADARLDSGAGYGAAVQAMVAWPTTEPLLLVVDESTTPGEVHVLRLSLAYRGSCLPLAWAVWGHQDPLPRGAYWRSLEGVLARAQALLPPEVPVIVLADRAYDLPGVIDRLAALGWHWIIRVKARSKLAWRDADGREQPLRALVTAQLTRPGQRLRRSGCAFKKAGWRPAHLVGEWGHGYAEPLVVLTSLDPAWTVLSRYARRFWIEAAFRQDKSRGWDWQHSQVRQPARQERLLLALAWATLLVLSLGAQQAAAATAALRSRTRPPQPSHPRDSLFALGLARFRAWLYGTVRGRLPWHLPGLTGPSWCAEWLTLHQEHPHAQSVPP
jgi:Transposase DDE domain